MIRKILINTVAILVVLILQQIVILFFKKENNKSQLKENFISILGASIFLGLMFTLVSEISHQFNYKIISFILMASIISTYWFIINPLKYMFRPKNYSRDFALEEDIQSEGYNYKIYFTDQIRTNAFATGIIPFYKIILVGKNLKEKLTQTELKAVIYHEIGHHENLHILKLFFINILVQTLFFLMFFEVNKLHFDSKFFEPLLVALTGGLGGLIFVYIPGKISYQFEYQADAFSAKNYNKKAITDALKKLNQISEGKFLKGNISHPNLEKRIKNIKKA